ncbi:MAG: hypothetical protein ACR2PF_01135 [Rhizobiaceae bacterium]
MKKTASTLLALIVTMAVAGCQSPFSGSSRRVAVATPPPAPANSTAALNGRWVPTDEATRGAYFAEFNNGKFISRDPQSKAAIAQGSYTVPSDTSVKLNFVGAASGKRIRADCLRSAPDRMTCTPTVGGTFNLQKTSAS